MWTALYLVLSFGFSWGLVAFAVTRGYFADGVGAQEGPILLVYMFGPALAAVPLALFARKSAPLSETLGLRFKPNLWWLVAWALPIVICAAALWPSTFGGAELIDPARAGENILEMARQQAGDIPETGLTAAQIFWVTLAQAVVIGALINGVLLLSEELGWRGFLWWRLRPMGFWPATLLTGVIWGLWHGPVIYFGYNYPGAGWAGVAMMTAFCTALTPLLSLVREQGRSVLAASILHGSLNAVAGVSLMLIPVAPVFWNGIMGWAGIGLLAVIGVALALIYRPKTEPA